MLESNSNLRTTILGTVVGGLILAAVLSFIPKAWAGFLWLLKSVFTLLCFKLSIPVWLLLILLLLGVLAFQLIRRKNAIATSPPIEHLGNSEKDSDPLSELEKSILQTMLMADGNYLGIIAIAEQTRSTNLLVEQAIEKLDGRKMLRRTQHFMGYTIFRLSSHGRDFALGEFSGRA